MPLPPTLHVEQELRRLTSLERSPDLRDYSSLMGVCEGLSEKGTFGAAACTAWNHASASELNATSPTRARNCCHCSNVKTWDTQVTIIDRTARPSHHFAKSASNCFNRSALVASSASASPVSAVSGFSG